MQIIYIPQTQCGENCGWINEKSIEAEEESYLIED